MKPPLSVGRAFVCLLLNVIVLPGLGTLLSGDDSRRGTGWLQLGLGLLLLPLTVASVLGNSGFFSFLNNDTARAWLANFVLILALWGAGTGISLIREARAAKKAHSATAG
jgi:hypothetical protein